MSKSKMINVRLNDEEVRQLQAVMQADLRSNKSDMLRVLIRRAFAALFADKEQKVSITEGGKSALHDIHQSRD